MEMPYLFPNIIIKLVDQLDSCKSKYKSFCSWKCIWICRLWNDGHFVEGGGGGGDYWTIKQEVDYLRCGRNTTKQ